VSRSRLILVLCSPEKAAAVPNANTKMRTSVNDFICPFYSNNRSLFPIFCRAHGLPLLPQWLHHPNR
jgi:hypothetical protein